LRTGSPDAARFWQVISPLIRQATEAVKPVHVFSGIVALLLPGHVEGLGTLASLNWAAGPAPRAVGTVPAGNFALGCTRGR